MSTESDFPIGTAVVSKANHNRKGIVIGNRLRNDSLVAVEWTDGELARVNVIDLLTEASLENEFQAFRDEVNAKLQEAAKLIGEASALAATRGKDLQDYDSECEDDLFDHYVLKSAMGQAGWNTSSWNC